MNPDYTLEPSQDYCIAWGNRGITLTLPGECITDISQPGDADETVRYWARKITRPESATPEAIAEELREYGAWDAEELADDAANWRRVIWLAACGAGEDPTQLFFPDGSEIEWMDGGEA